MSPSSTAGATLHAAYLEHVQMEAGAEAESWWANRPTGRLPARRPSSAGRASSPARAGRSAVPLRANGAAADDGLPIHERLHREHAARPPSAYYRAFSPARPAPHAVASKPTSDAAEGSIHERLFRDAHRAPALTARARAGSPWLNGRQQGPPSPSRSASFERGTYAERVRADAEMRSLARRQEAASQLQRALERISRHAPRLAPRAVRIQAAWRGYALRREMRAVHTAARTLQRAARRRWPPATREHRLLLREARERERRRADALAARAAAREAAVAAARARKEAQAAAEAQREAMLRARSSPRRPLRATSPLRMPSSPPPPPLTTVAWRRTLRADAPRSEPPRPRPGSAASREVPAPRSPAPSSRAGERAPSPSPSGYTHSRASGAGHERADTATSTLWRAGRGSSSPTRSRGGRGGGGGGGDGGSVYERLFEAAEMRQQRLEEKRARAQREAAQAELAECTFEPDLTRSADSLLLSVAGAGALDGAALARPRRRASPARRAGSPHGRAHSVTRFAVGLDAAIVDEGEATTELVAHGWRSPQGYSDYSDPEPAAGAQLDVRPDRSSGRAEDAHWRAGSVRAPRARTKGTPDVVPFSPELSQRLLALGVSLSSSMESGAGPAQTAVDGTAGRADADRSGSDRLGAAGLGERSSTETRLRGHLSARGGRPDESPERGAPSMPHREHNHLGDDLKDYGGGYESSGSAAASSAYEA